MYKGNPEEVVMSPRGREDLGKEGGGVVIREGFLENIPPELDWKYN